MAILKEIAKKNMGDISKIAKIISQFQDYHKKTKMYVPLQGPKIEFSEVEKNAILNNKKIFFQASKSRILLMVWLCKIIRKTFELYNYSDLDMPNETYEILRDNFKTKAFNRANFLEAFNCENTNILTYQNFLEIEKDYISNYNKYVDNNDKLSLITHISIKKPSKIISYKKELDNIFSLKRNTDVIYLRAQGKTLDEIGLKLSVTRERARQIEFKPKNNIERWLISRKQDILQNICNDYLIDESKARKELGEKEWIIIKYVIMSSNKKQNEGWKYYEPLDIVFYSNNKNIEEDILLAKNNTLNKKYPEIITSFTKEMIELGYLFFNENLTKKYFKNNDYSIYGEEVHEGKITIGKAILAISKKYFKDGIKITDKEQLDEFANKTNEIFKLSVKSERAFSTRIQDVLIMSNKGTYICPELLQIDRTLIEEIENYISNMNEKQVTYESLYKIFEQNLKENSNIDNAYFLHGALKYFTDNNNSKINCFRYYVSKKDIVDLKSKEFFRDFYNYLKQNNGPVTVEKLLSDFPSWKEMYFRYSIAYFPSIVQWSQNEYVCLEVLDISKNDFNYLRETALSLCNNKYKYTSSYLIYDKIKSENNQFLLKLNITNESELFHVLQFCLNEEFYCKRPHIIKDFNKKSFSTQDLVKLVIGTKKIINKQNLVDELVCLYGNKNSSLSLSVQRELKNFIKISTYEYLNKKEIKLDNEKISLIEKNIKDNMIKGEVLLPNKINNFSNFPNINCKWNSWILCEIIAEYNLNFKIIGKRNTPSQNTMSIVLKQNSKLNNKKEIFNWLLKNDYKGSLEKNELFQYAKSIGIFHTNLTSDDIEEYKEV